MMSTPTSHNLGAPRRRSADSGRTRPGGRTSVTLSKILQAATLELAESGYAALSFDVIARRAGVHRTSLYRRWADVDALILDAVLAGAERDVPSPDTGSLADDLSLLVHSVVENLASPKSQALVRLAATETGSGGPAGRVVRQFWATRFDAAAQLVIRAQQRGETPPDINPRLTIEMLVAPLFLRLLVTGMPLDHAFADTVLERVLTGVGVRRPRAPLAADRAGQGGSDPRGSAG